jgi:hypothetical protein
MCQTELERRAHLCGMKAMSAFGGSAGVGNSQRDFQDSPSRVMPCSYCEVGCGGLQPIIQSWPWAEFVA